MEKLKLWQKLLLGLVSLIFILLALASNALVKSVGI